MIRKAFYKTLFELNGRPAVANTLKKFASSSASSRLIPSFAKLYGINTEEAALPFTSYKSLHEFFIRELKEGVRPVALEADAFVSPCDGELSVIEDLTEDSRFTVKGQSYTVSELLGSHHDASQYAGGKVMIFYLSPTDYHRVHVPLDSEVLSSYTLGRDAAPVNGIGLKYGLRPLTRNYRLITTLRSKGVKYAHVMVGALNVNTIVRTNEEREVARGEAFGYFSFGSTVVVCAPKGALSIDTPKGKVRMGQRIGTWHS